MHTEKAPNTRFVRMDCSQRPPTGQECFSWRPTTSVWMHARLGEPAHGCHPLPRHCEDVHSVNRAPRCTLSVRTEWMRAVHTSSKRRPHSSKVTKSWSELHIAFRVAIACIHSRRAVAVNSQCPCVTAVTSVDCSQRPPTGQECFSWRPTTSVWMHARLGEPAPRVQALARRGGGGRQHAGQEGGSV